MKHKKDLTIAFLLVVFLISGCAYKVVPVGETKPEPLYSDEGEGIFIIPNRKGDYDLVESLKVLKKDHPKKEVVSVVLEKDENDSTSEKGWIVITKEKQ